MKKKRENNYSTTKVKARNFLTNVSYFRVKESDLVNKSFVVDCYSFIVLNLNPFYLERKFEIIEDRQRIEMLWNVLMPQNFFTHICQTDIYNVLISTKLKFQDVLEIVKIFCDDKENYEQMEQFLKKNLHLYQFVHATLFPKCFSRIDDYGIHSKLEFENIFRSWQNQKNLTWQLPLYELKEEKTESVLANPPNTPLVDEKIEEIEAAVKENKEKKTKKRKISLPSEKKITKRNEKKKKLEDALQQNDRVFSLINFKK